MGIVEGTQLSDMWFDLQERDDLEERDIISITRQVTELESNLMLVAFPARGSLYYASDLVFGTSEDERFCVSPVTRLPLQFGRRSQLDRKVPKQHSSGAGKERAYLNSSVDHCYRSSVQGRTVPLPEAASVRPHKQSGPLSPHRVVVHPREPDPHSFPHPPSRPPAGQYQVARL